MQLCRTRSILAPGLKVNSLPLINGRELHLLNGEIFQCSSPGENLKCLLAGTAKTEDNQSS